MKKIFVIILSLLVLSCTQGVRVENDFLDEIRVLIASTETQNSLKIIGQKSGTEYSSNLTAADGLGGNIPKILREEDDLFIVYKENKTIISLDEDDFSLKTKYEITDIGSPLDLHFPNTSNGYFTVEGSDTIYILDRISKEIAQINIPVSSQPNKVTSIANKLYVTMKDENSILVVTTNTKQELASISTPGIVEQFIFRENSTELVAICKNNLGMLSAVYIDTETNTITSEVEMMTDENQENPPQVLCIASTPELFDFIWVGTDNGVFRVDLRDKNRVDYFDLNLQVLNIYFNIRDVNNSMIYLGKSSNGAAKLVQVDPLQFSEQSNVPLDDNIQLIYPLF
ncbi:hypothetical protein OAQ99_02025 [Candidatus Kapabacteria bacterium]|nr:hypothetical protein [Candidatus Kapabacteria bacterium]